MDTGSSPKPTLPPQVSADGRFWWDGKQWVPFVQSATVVPGAAVPGQIAEGVASGIFKALLILTLPVLALIVFIMFSAALGSGSGGGMLVALVGIGLLALACRALFRKH